LGLSNLVSTVAKHSDIYYRGVEKECFTYREANNNAKKDGIIVNVISSSILYISYPFVPLDKIALTNFV